MQLINYLDSALVVDQKYRKPKYYHNYVLQKWDKNTFQIDKKKLKRFNTVAQAGPEKDTIPTTVDSLVTRLSQELISTSGNVIVSSVMMDLGIEIEYKGRTYSCFQSSLGDSQVFWKVAINEQEFGIIAPEMNNWIAELMPKKMGGKVALHSFIKVKTWLEVLGYDEWMYDFYFPSKHLKKLRKR
ncbi:MAG: hypothetical protein MK212_04610 [Saprospiraceae bacterium]|nr:hypothetical protein [Saprospiraceae bacterium]